MDHTQVDVPMGKIIAEHLTVTVRATSTRMALLRLRLAIPFLWLGSKIAGCGLDIDSVDVKRD